MADNFLHRGDVVKLTAPATLTSGKGVLVGKVFGVALHDAASGDPVEVLRIGVFTLPKLSTDVVTEGAVLYWNDTNKEVQLTASTHKRIGFAENAAGSGVLTVGVILTGEASDS